MTSAAPLPDAPSTSLRQQVRSAVIWRSGSQIVGQLIAWASTFLVIRILSPADYGLYAMTSVVLLLLSMMNGYGLANAVIQRPKVTPRLLRQLFGMLIVLNGGLAVIQFATAPLVAAYYEQPMVIDLLRLQALLYLANPFLALSYAVLAREMDFRKQAQANLAAGVAAALVALAGALGGLGVWTLVLAPLVGAAVRAAGMTIAARSFILPSFDFRGAWSMARYGGVVVLGQFFWFLQTQADIVIAGRALDPHALGIYTTSLFLTLLFVNKFVPPINEVAFSAYARVQDDAEAYAQGFLKSVRILMLAGVPFSLGLAATAEPVVRVVLGEKWIATAPVIAIVGCAAPFMMLQVLFGPAVNAASRPEIYTRTSLLGALLLPVAYVVGIQWGLIGLALAWVVGYPLLVALSSLWVLPVLHVSPRALVEAAAPPVLAGIAMVVAVRLLDHALPGMAPILRLAILVAGGGAIYGAWLIAFARGRLAELVDLARRKG
ncbi:capsular biosynthesis protein CapK [Altererythrobacter sp. B11]|uniref:lipopolysaccharide biosynthesis protein n=1 Tax=Altererythrobacter sp. B11 TaxID=2060312 RepID=UPI000DC6DB41|nr:lipopolysaccharide biosynthesis protein [Altererythrobacter sp. B11]BBC72024.1 capsular biosynthesis protein CapK [Altererythrobacter sp. B11]